MVRFSSANGSARVNHPAGASASSTLHLWGFSLLRKTCPGHDSSYYLQTLSRQQRSYSYIYTYRTFCISLLLTGLQIFLHLYNGLMMLWASPCYSQQGRYCRDARTPAVGLSLCKDARATVSSVCFLNHSLSLRLPRK